MAQTTNSFLKVTIVYNDYTTRTYTIPDYDTDNLEQTRARIKAINANVPDIMKYTFVSENYDISDPEEPYGVFAQIQEAEVIVEESEVVYGYGA